MREGGRTMLLQMCVGIRAEKGHGQHQRSRASSPAQSYNCFSNMSRETLIVTLFSTLYILCLPSTGAGAV